MPLTNPSDIVERIVGFSLEHLPKTRLPNGLYCFDWPYGGPLRGESHRYSLMVLLGLQRSAAAGLADLPDDPELLWGRIIARRADFTPGDVGLALWADSRRDGSETDTLVKELDVSVPDTTALEPLAGMEIGWMISGLSQAVAGGHAGAEAPLRRLLDHLRQARMAPTGLAYHQAGGLRSRLPNFATEIYTVLCLAQVAKAALDDDALLEAETLARHLLRLQLPDGGWPWLFDANRAKVVERYEVYSVHQDAMAPMAFLELTEATGDQRYAAAAVKGLAWSHGQNELHADLFDDTAGFAHRSIRRRKGWDRGVLYANSAVELAAGRPLQLGGLGQVELNQTCRPYHLGWILEAWAGRQAQATVAPGD